MRGKKSLVIAAVLVLPFAACVCHSGQYVEEFVRATIGMIGWDTHLKANMSAKLNQICADPELPREVERCHPNAEIPRTVIVVGESATRRHWHLYGYPHRTTDAIESVRNELVVFQDVNAAASTTFPALRLLMTCASVEHPDDFKYTFSSVAKRAGLRTAFYTMCQRWGGGVGSVSVLFNGCDEIVHLNEALGSEFKGYDGELLPYLRRGLEKFDLQFLHTVGSHYPFGCHVPADYAKSKFSASKTEAYDRSVDYTDWFLGEVIAELKKSTKPAMMIYLSDHGETPEAASWRDVTDLSCWEVPMIVWFSESYRRKFPENVALAETASGKPLRSDELLHGLLRLCGIKPMSEEMDFLSEGFVSRRVTGGCRANSK